MAQLNDLVVLGNTSLIGETKISSDIIAPQLILETATGEGGQIQLRTALNDTTNSGVVIDTANGDFRVFGLPSRNGTTRTGSGTVFTIDPYDKTLSGGYSVAGTLAVNDKIYSKNNIELTSTSSKTNPWIGFKTDNTILGYVQLSGTTMYIGNGASNSLSVDNTGKTSTPQSYYTSNTSRGYYLKDSAGNAYPGIYDNGTNLWLGSTATASTHHKGQTYISAGHNGTSGNSTIFISVPNAANNNGTNYGVFHTGYLDVSKATTGTLVIARGGTGATTAAAARTNLGVPPTNHASTATTYGVGNSNNYGHVILYNAADCTSYTSDSGGACTPAAVKKAVQTFGLTTSNSQLVDTSAAATALASVVSIGSATPASTYKLWIDTGNGSILKYYNGSSWVKAGAIWS